MRALKMCYFYLNIPTHSSWLTLNFAQRVETTPWPVILADGSPWINKALVCTGLYGRLGYNSGDPPETRISWGTNIMTWMSCFNLRYSEQPLTLVAYFQLCSPQRQSLRSVSNYLCGYRIGYPGREPVYSWSKEEAQRSVGPTSTMWVLIVV